MDRRRRQPTGSASGRAPSPVGRSRRCPPPDARPDAGQALAITVLWLSILVILTLGVAGTAVVVSARAALSKADAAAALAVVREGTASVRLAVSYVDYACGVSGEGRAPACRGTPGALTLDGITASAFEGDQNLGFGNLPPWASLAGCVGTRWPGSAPDGTYRICLRARGESVAFTYPDAGSMQRMAQSWLRDNLTADGELWGPSVTEVSVGPQGQVTVDATAAIRPAVLMFRSTSVQATAWPGPLR